MHTCKLLIETHESLGNPAMKGTRNWIQPFQWASNRTAKMKLTMRAMDLVALKICRNVFVYMALFMCSCLPAEYHPEVALFPGLPWLQRFDRLHQWFLCTVSDQKNWQKRRPGKEANLESYLGNHCYLFPL